MARLRTKSKKRAADAAGRLRIGDDWNAITIIALSQSNPLKAVAEFVENSIDAAAKNVTITRGRERGEHYLIVGDDGDGVPKDADGRPDFRYVATHICDSIKRRLKANGADAIQGEFGIGLLSFWTVGEEITMTSAGTDGKTYQMRMQKGDPNYSIGTRRRLFPARGTELKVKPLLAGIRQLSGDKIQSYLASELRDRIRRSGVQIKVVDRHARKQFIVEPREFNGRLLHNLPPARTRCGEIYLELYLSEPKPTNRIGLYRSGTRVLENLGELAPFGRPPWTDGSLEGIIDAPFLNLTPGTRTGVIQDGVYAAFCTAMVPIKDVLLEVVDKQRKAEEERASQQMLRSIQKAFREAMLALPPEDYDWFEIQSQSRAGRPGSSTAISGEVVSESAIEDRGGACKQTPQKAFFDFAGPLFSVRVSPASCVVQVGESKQLRAVARDRSRHVVDHDLKFHWKLADGDGALENIEDEFVRFVAPAEPALVRVAVTVTQNDVTCDAEALVTVTDSLVIESKNLSATKHGLPGYTFKRAPGELWRSRYDAEQNVIIINNGHRDFVYASRTRALKMRYITRLFTKELVYKNFPGYSSNELLERMVELSLYTEESLK